MNKKIVWSDIDGCIGKFVKPEYPLKQDLNGNLKNLELIKNKTLEFKNTLFGVSTGRSFHIADNIMEHSNHKGPSILEMGNVIFEPETGVYNLFEKDSILKDSIEIIKNFIEWKKEMEAHEREIKDKFRVANVRHMKERKCMLTYEFNKNIGRELYGFILKNKMPPEIKDAIKTGVLKVLFCDIAIDILPNLDKGYAADFLLKKYCVKKENSLSIGDSSHSDLDILNITGLVGCPDNADAGIKKFVLSKGDKGFISNRGYSEGMIDILNEVHKRWSYEEKVN